MDSWNSACVPTTSLISPLATASSALRRVRAGIEPVISATGISSGAKPALEILRVLLGQQFGRRHERGLQSAAHGARGGGGGHHGLAAAHVALHQPHHGPIGGEIAIDFGERARLRAGERERQRLRGSGARGPPRRASGHGRIAAGSPGAAAAATAGARAVLRRPGGAAPDDDRSAVRPGAHRAAADASSSARRAAMAVRDPRAWPRESSRALPSRSASRSASSISERSRACGTPSVVG